MKVLLIPVSAARGFGEYARMREIAIAIQRRWPQAQLHFLLSEQAAYAEQCPFPATLLPGSATLHTPQVIETLEAFRPDLVIFDNAGRTAQLRAARRVGARIIYISSRRRQRGKAFRLTWMRLLNEHWIAYPSFIAGDLTWLERLKLRWLGRPRVRFIDTVLPAPARAGDEVLPQLRDFVLVVPGGATPHPGALSAPQVMEAAAQGIAAGGLYTVLVGPEAGASSPTLTRLPLLPQIHLVDLMRRARIVVSNGGDTLLQALACNCACVAVPIAHDQAARIQRCLALGLTADAPLASAAIIAAVMALHEDEGRRAALLARGHAAGIIDAMPQIMEWIGLLAAHPGS